MCKKFGLGEHFKKWITLIYTNPIASLKVNGFLSKPIPISRGVKQGCPLSALICILCTEILATSIRNDKNINGITIPNSDKNKS